MNNTELSIFDFTTAVPLMRLASELKVFPTEYVQVSVNDVLKDINAALATNNKPVRIKYVDDDQKIEYLRFEEERLDRVLYIISCLIKRPTN